MKSFVQRGLFNNCNFMDPPVYRTGLTGPGVSVFFIVYSDKRHEIQYSGMFLFL